LGGRKGDAAVQIDEGEFCCIRCRGFKNVCYAAIAWTPRQDNTEKTLSRG
jgi:hypothetical protein